MFGKNVAYTAHYNCPPIISSINLDKSEVCTKHSEAEIESQQIKVSVVHTDYENDVVIFNFEVSGGKIIGRGSKVVWDLSGTQPGIYTITVCLDDGIGCDLEGAKNKLTKEIRVIECPDCKE